MAEDETDKGNEADEDSDGSDNDMSDAHDDAEYQTDSTGEDDSAKGVSEEADSGVVEETQASKEAAPAKAEGEEDVKKEEDVIRVQKKNNPLNKKPLVRHAKKSVHTTARKTHAQRIKAEKQNKSNAKEREKEIPNAQFKISRKSLLIWSIVIAVIVILLVAGYMLFTKLHNPDASQVAAVVGGETITVKELTGEYAKLPSTYQSVMTKRTYLENVMIPQKLLLNAASSVPDSEVLVQYDNYLSSSNMTEAELTAALAEEGLTLVKFKDLIKIQDYLNKTIGSRINVTDQDVKDYYQASKEMLVDENNMTIPFNNISQEIRDFLRNKMFQDEAAKLIKQLTDSAQITILYEDESTGVVSPAASIASVGATFDVTNDSICTEDGKPVIRMFSTTWCPHCNWVKQAYDDTVKQYVAEGKIVAHHWQVDTGDDTLTSTVEATVPSAELAVYKKYNPEGSIPTFIFGCRYVRIGNGYEAKNDLTSEKAEFRATIDILIAEAGTG